MVNSRDDIETFVVIHSQDLVLECEREGRFGNVKPFQYLFVGNGDTSRLRDVGNVIIARDLRHNIEDYPNLLSFTGWYALAKNHLVTTRWVTILEYDVHLVDRFQLETIAALSSGRSQIGYVAFPLSHPMYLHATPWLLPSLQTIHGLDASCIVADYLNEGGKDEWTATTNAALSADDLSAFVDWFDPVSRVFRHDPIGAHVHERCLPIFCIQFGINNKVVPGILRHEQRRSHGFLARSRSEANQESASLKECQSRID